MGGRSRRRRRRSSRRRSRRRSARRRPATPRARALPGVRDPRRSTDRITPHARGERWPMRPVGRSSRWRIRPHAAGTRPGEGEHAHSGVHRGGHGTAATGWPWRERSRGAAARSTSPPRSAWARAARRRDREGATQAVPDLEIDWLAQQPGDEGPPGRGRADPPGERTARERVRTSRASQPSTTCTRSRRSGAWTRSSARTSCSSTTSCATSSTTSGSATRRGRSTTTCTRTPRRSAPPTSGSRTSSAGSRCPTAASASRSSRRTTTRR